MSMSEQERREYRDYMISVHVAKDVVETAKSDGFREGYGHGMEQGIKQGIEQVEQKARQEKMASARRMKSRGYSIADIAEILGLSESELEALS